MTNRLSNYTQKLTNYYPLYYNVRAYPYSSGSRLLNTAGIELEDLTIKLNKTFNDRWPLTHSQSGIPTLCVSKSFDNLTGYSTLKFDGFVGPYYTDTYTFESPIFTAVDPLLNYMYFESPKYMIHQFPSDGDWFMYNGDGTPFQFDSFSDPAPKTIAYNYYKDTTWYSILTTSETIPYEPTFYLQNIFGNTDLNVGYKIIKITGKRLGVNSHDDFSELIYPGLDGIYKSKYRWEYIEYIEYFNMKSVEVTIYPVFYTQSIERIVPRAWYTPETREDQQTFIKWDAEHSCFIHHKKVYNAVGESDDEVISALFINGPGILGRIDTIADFDVDPFSRFIYVIPSGGFTSDNVYLYRLEEDLQLTHEATGNLKQHSMCPYNIKFEVHDYDQVVLKIENKFINNPFDYEFGLLVTVPSGGQFLIDGEGTPTSYTGELLDFSQYPKRFIYNLDSPGIYKFTLKYYDSEERIYREQDFIYNHRELNLVNYFRAAESETEDHQMHGLTAYEVSFDRIKCLCHNEIAVRTVTGDYTYYFKGYNPAIYWDNANKLSYFIDFTPTTIWTTPPNPGEGITGTGVDFELTEWITGERYLAFGELFDLGDVNG